MKRALLLPALLAACSTVPDDAQIERLSSRCTSMGFERNTDQHSQCVFGLARSDADNKGNIIVGVLGVIAAVATGAFLFAR